MDAFISESLELRVDEAAPADLLRVVWLGSANLRKPSEELQPLFARWSDEASQSGRALEFRLERLKHFNSSTVLALVQLAQALRARGVKFRLVYDAKLKWQKVTFEALKQVSKRDSLFELEGEPSR